MLIVVLLQELIVFSIQITILLCVNGFIMMSPLFKAISSHLSDQPIPCNPKF